MSLSVAAAGGLRVLSSLQKRLPFLLCLAVLLLGAALRLHDLGGQSLWNDEGNSYVQSTRTFAEIAVHAARDIHPPGYYWLLGAWRLLTGESEFALRSPSAFASLLSIAFTFALGRRLFGGWIGLMAALLVMLNTFSIYYAQEARMYSLLALWAAASIWAWAGLTKAAAQASDKITRQTRRDEMRRTRRSASLRAQFVWGMMLALCNAAGMWTHFSYPLVMLAQGALTLLWLAGLWRRAGSGAAARLLAVYVVVNLLTLALFLPWLPNALAQLSGWQQPADPTPLPEALGAILNLLTFGVTHAYSSSGALAIANMLLLFGALPQKGRRQAWVLVPVLWVLAAVGVFLAFDLFRPGNLKFLLPAQIALALWLARGVAVVWRAGNQQVRSAVGATHASPLQIRMMVFKTAAVVGLGWLVFNLAAGIAPLYDDPAYRRADYRSLVETITAALQPGDAIILNAPNQEEVFRYYYHAAAPVYPLPPGLGGDDSATRAAVESLVRDYQRAFVVFWGEAERDPQRIVETTLDASAYEVSDVWYGDVRLARYVMPAPMGDPVVVDARFGESITLERYALSAEAVEAGGVLQLELRWRTDALLAARYKVFVQLLDETGALAAQRDSEPGGGLALTTTWQPGETIIDRHGLPLPESLSSAHYLLIVGLYNINDAGARLAVDGHDYLALTTVTITSGE